MAFHVSKKSKWQDFIGNSFEIDLNVIWTEKRITTLDIVKYMFFFQYEVIGQGLL